VKRPRRRPGREALRQHPLRRHGGPDLRRRPRDRVLHPPREDPALENNREEAENLLEQVGDDYERAEQAYAEPGTWPTRTRTS
jgi:hypothetical protein